MKDARSDSYFSIIVSKPLKVMVCAVTLVAFLFNIISYDLAWSATQLPISSPTIFKELNATTFSLPKDLGTIKYSWSSPQSTLRRGLKLNNRLAQSESLPPVVIHIQDAHCNYAAQKRIAQIIEYLNKEYGIDTVNLEGGAEGYDLSLFTDIKESNIREKAADYFVKEGLVNGAEYFAINNPGKIDLWGVEDVKLYIDNLSAYRNSLKHKDEIDKYLKSLSYILSNLKRNIYSRELLEFDSKYNQYKAGNFEFRDYVGYVLRIAKERAVDVRSFRDIYLLDQTLSQEGSIDFKKANIQRDALIDRFRKVLSTNELKGLVAMALSFRTGKTPQEEFYKYLLRKSKEVNIDLSEFPELKKYIVYVSIYAGIDKAKVMDELAALEERIKETLHKNDEDRKLALLSKNLALTRNIFNISITKDDYKYYLDNKASFNVRNYVSFINKHAVLYKIAAALDENIGDLDRYREEMVKFYEYSLKRDKAFLKNIKVKNTAIIVTGGFHTDNLAELFKKNNISYVSIMPNFKDGNGYECPYFKIISGKKSLKIRELLPSALKNVLAIPDPLCPRMAEADRLPVVSLPGSEAAAPIVKAQSGEPKVDPADLKFYSYRLLRKIWRDDPGNVLLTLINGISGIYRGRKAYANLDGVDRALERSVDGEDYFITFYKDMPVAAYNFKQYDDFAGCSGIYVPEDRREIGIGLATLEALCTYLAAKGVTDVTINVDLDAGGQGLHKRFVAKYPEAVIKLTWANKDRRNLTQHDSGEILTNYSINPQNFTPIWEDQIIDELPSNVQPPAPSIKLSKGKGGDEGRKLPDTAGDIVDANKVYGEEMDFEKKLRSAKSEPFERGFIDRILELLESTTLPDGSPLPGRENMRGILNGMDLFWTEGVKELSWHSMLAGNGHPRDRIFANRNMKDLGEARPGDARWQKMHNLRVVTAVAHEMKDRIIKYRHPEGMKKERIDTESASCLWEYFIFEHMTKDFDDEDWRVFEEYRSEARSRGVAIYDIRLCVRLHNMCIEKGYRPMRVYNVLTDEENEDWELAHSIYDLLRDWWANIESYKNWHDALTLERVKKWFVIAGKYKPLKEAEGEGRGMPNATGGEIPESEPEPGKTPSIGAKPAETRRDEEQFNGVVRQIGKEIKATKKPDGKYDLKAAVRTNGKARKEPWEDLYRLENGTNGRLYMTDDGILVVIDDRFSGNRLSINDGIVYLAKKNSNHGRGIALMRLRAWREFALREKIAQKGDFENGELRQKIYTWASGKDVPGEAAVRKQEMAAEAVAINKWSLFAGFPDMPSTKPMDDSWDYGMAQAAARELNSKEPEEKRQAARRLAEYTERVPAKLFLNARFDTEFEVVRIPKKDWDAHFGDGMNGYTANGILLFPEGADLLPVLHEKRHLEAFVFDYSLESEIDAYFASLLNLIKMFHAGDPRATEELQTKIAKPSNENEIGFLQKWQAEYKEDYSTNPVKRGIVLEAYRIAFRFVHQKDYKDLVQERDKERIKELCRLLALCLLRDADFYRKARIADHLFFEGLNTATLLSNFLSPQLGFVGKVGHNGFASEFDFTTDLDDILSKAVSAAKPPEGKGKTEGRGLPNTTGSEEGKQGPAEPAQGPETVSSAEVVTSETIQQLMAAPGFKRLGRVQGFTGPGPDIERKYADDLAEQRHDIRVGRMAEEMTKRYNLNPQWAAFIALTHNYAALPFRHLTASGKLGRQLTKIGYVSQEHVVRLLEQEGFVLSEKMKNDLLGFDKEGTERGLSREATLCLAADKIIGTVEDILLGLKFNLFKYADIPPPVVAILCLGAVGKGSFEKRLKEDFDNLVVEVATKALTSGAEDLSVDEILVMALEIKRICREEFIDDKIYKVSNTPEAIEAVDRLIVPVYEKFVGEYRTAHPEDKDEMAEAKYAVDKLVKMTDDDVINFNRLALSKQAPVSPPGAKPSTPGGGAAIIGAMEEGETLLAELKATVKDLEAKAKEVGDKPKKGVERERGWDSFMAALQRNKEKANDTRLIEEMLSALGLPAGWADRIFLLDLKPGRIERVIEGKSNRLGGVLIRHNGVIKIILPRERIKNINPASEDPVVLAILGDLLHETTEIELLEAGMYSKDAHWHAQRVRDAWLAGNGDIKAANKIRSYLQEPNPWGEREPELEMANIVTHLSRIKNIDDLTFDRIKRFLLRILGERIEGWAGSPECERFSSVLTIFLNNEKMGGMINRLKRDFGSFSKEALIVILQRLHTFAVMLPEVGYREKDLPQIDFDSIIINAVPTYAHRSHIFGYWRSIVPNQEVIRLLERGDTKGVIGRFDKSAPWNKALPPEDLKAIAVYFGIDVEKMEYSYLLNQIKEERERINPAEGKRTAIVDMDEADFTELTVNARKDLIYGLLLIVKAKHRLESTKDTKNLRIERFIGRGVDGIVLAGYIGDRKVAVKISIPRTPLDIPGMMRVQPQSVIKTMHKRKHVLEDIVDVIENSGEMAKNFATNRNILRYDSPGFGSFVIEISDFVEGVRLNDLVTQKDFYGIGLGESLDLLTQFVEIESFLNKKGLANADIPNLKNFIVESNGTLKFVDLGGIIQLENAKDKDTLRNAFVISALRIVLGQRLGSVANVDVESFVRAFMARFGKENDDLGKNIFLAMTKYLNPDSDLSKLAGELKDIRSGVSARPAIPRNKIIGAAEDSQIKEVGIDDLEKVSLPEGEEYSIYKIAGREIYHIEFSSEVIQQQAVGRLMAFLESSVNAGRVLSEDEMNTGKESEIRKLNIGSDFSIYDICRFYDAARGVRFNILEELLLADLLRHGFVKFDSAKDRYVALKEAAVITIAQDADEIHGEGARLVALWHEFCHSLYRLNAGYRARVRKIWDGLAPADQNLIRDILASAFYNVADEDVLLKEFAAYCLDIEDGLSYLVNDNPSERIRNLFAERRETLLYSLQPILKAAANVPAAAEVRDIYTQEGRKTLVEFSNSARDKSEPRIFVIPIKDYPRRADKYAVYKYEGLYAEARNSAEDSFEELGFNKPIIIFYDGTPDGLKEVKGLEVFTDAMGEKGALALVYSAEDQYDAVKGEQGIFKDFGERAQCIKESIPEAGFVDVFGHVALGMGILDYVNHGLKNYEGNYDVSRLENLFTRLGILDDAAANEWRENSLKFLSDLLKGIRALRIKIFEKIAELRHAYKEVSKAA